MMLGTYASSGNLITLLQVLDMCAAPGSKTAQLIEYLHNTPDNQIPGMQYTWRLTLFKTNINPVFWMLNTLDC